MNLRKLVLLVVWGWFVGGLCVFPWTLNLAIFAMSMGIF